MPGGRGHARRSPPSTSCSRPPRSAPSGCCTGCKDEGDLPRLSDRLGYLTRTNSESILGAIAPDLAADYSQGVAITSSFHPDEHTHIEPVRYGKGSQLDVR